MSIEKVIIDFDHTLFDADDFKVALASSLRQFGVTDEIFWGTYRHARDLVGKELTYSFEKHVELIKQRVKIDEVAALQALREILSRSEEFLFPDAKDFLGRLISLGIPTVLLTRGNPEFQRAKIMASGIDKLVNEVIVSDKRKEEEVKKIIEGMRGIIFSVDDHLDETLAIIDANPKVTPILKRRPDQSPERYLGIRMLNFRTLNEIRDYLTIVHATHPSYANEN